jgi:phenylpyruvate tautomerase PptA (4-oxalocrotonate tautomerase family)
MTALIVQKESLMPMIDVYASAGMFSNKHQLAIDLATTVMTIEQVPNIPMFRQNTAAFVHELPTGDLANVDGDTDYVRVQVLTNAGAIDRDKQLAVVKQLTEVVSKASGGVVATDHIWIMLSEAAAGGWGLDGHANTNEELVTKARAQIAELRAEAAQ